MHIDIVNVYRDCVLPVQVVQVPSSIEQLLEVANIRLCIHSTSITNELGGRIEDLEVIR